MKKVLGIISLVAIVVLVYIYKDTISNFITDNIIYGGHDKVLSYNEYYMENDYLFVQNIDSNEVTNYQELLNIFYTIINSGDDVFTFTCKYDGCLTDVRELVYAKTTISEINNLVNPYNSFSTINVDITNSGKVTVKVTKAYNEKKIKYIEEFVDKFINEKINDNMSQLDKIKEFHDYIINITIYDEENNDDSYTAYDLIKTGKSICGGYSDIMAIYLNKLGIKNYRIASGNHIWNLVNLDDKWYHLDLTWDDPIASDGNQYLLHTFFMIDTNTLLSLDTVEHNFNKDIYLEAK